MKKLIACLFGLFITLPAFAITCNLYNVADGWLAGYPTGEGTWSATPQEATIMMHLEEGKKYTIVRVAGSGSTFRVQASSTPTLTHGQSLVIINNQGDENVTTKTITVPNGAPYVLIYIRNNKLNAQTCANGFMIVEGSTAPTEYIPYDASCPCPEGQVLQTYTSETGTATQNGTPSPENPVYPTFSKQGNMPELRAVGDIADSYDATTGKITRRVGYVELDGTETWGRFDQTMDVIYGSVLSGSATNTRKALSNALYFNSSHQSTTALTTNEFFKGDNNAPNRLYINLGTYTDTTIADWKTYLAQQKAAGTPVIIYYPLAEATTEDWAAEQCVAPIKIATVKYNNAAFSDVVTGLNTAISTIKTVVANTIAQTAAVASLQSGKQTKPADADCPAGKKCLLVEDANGTPHWYEIVESYYNPTLPVGYTELAYLESTGTQYIDPDVDVTSQYSFVITFASTSGNSWQTPYGIYVNNGSSFGNIFNTDNDKFYIYSGNSDTLSYDFSQNIDYTFDYDGVNKVFKINDSYTYDFSGLHGFSGTAHPYLLRLANFSSNYYLIGKLYSFKLKNADGTLVRDMIPARRESDGVLGMYDLANNQFYTNAGSGTFTAGPVVLPSGFTTLEYVSFSSPAETYFDTGIHLSNNHTIGMTVNAENLNGAMGRFISGGKSFQLYDKYYRFGDYMANNTLSSHLNTKVTISYGQSGLYVGNTLIATPTTQTFTHTDTNTCLVGAYGGGSASFKGKIYNAWIKENGTLVANYIPAKNSSNVVGMYDLMDTNPSTAFHTNQGTGTFTAGPVAQ